MTFPCSSRTTRSAFALTAIFILTLGSVRLTHAAPPAAENQAVVLKDADTMEAEFRTGAAGKIGLAFKFADGKTQTLLGAVKSDALKRTVEKDGRKVPEVLLSGHHGEIRRWRKREALMRTLQRRPELLATAELDDEERQILRELQQRGQ